MLVIDDSGDRQDGTETAHVGRQWLGRNGKTDNGVVTVTTVWASERVCCLVHAVPYTPASTLPRGSTPIITAAIDWPLPLALIRGPVAGMPNSGSISGRTSFEPRHGEARQAGTSI